MYNFFYSTLFIVDIDYSVLLVMARGRKSDLNHKFPVFKSFSRVLPGDERIHENVLVEKKELKVFRLVGVDVIYSEPITGTPDGAVSTVYDALQRAVVLSNNGPFLGELCDQRYILHEAQILGSALLYHGIHPGENTRVGIAGIHSVRYMTTVYALMSYSMVLVPLYHNSKIDVLCDIINKCELEVIFCDNEARAETIIDKIKDGVIYGSKKLVILNTTSPQSNGKYETVEGVEVYSYEHMIAIGQQNTKPVVPPSQNSTYIICFTSGTTGQPKGVQLSHHSLITAMGGLYIQLVPPPNRFLFSHNDVYFSFLSLAHIYEHLMQAFVIYIGGRIGIYSGDVSRLLSNIKILRPTIVSLVPRLLNKFHDHIHKNISKKNFFIENCSHTPNSRLRAENLAKLEMLHNGIQRHDTIWDKLVFKSIHKKFGGRLRMLTTGGAPVTPTVMDFTRIAYGCPLMEGYGQTECGAAGTISLPFDCTAGHVGGPAPWAQVKLVDVPELCYFAADDKGEVCFRGVAIMSGYFMDEELSRSTIDEEGWLHTGDIGEWQENGALKIIDRKNALFKLAQGDFVSPEQIESVYLCSPLIDQMYITGLPIHSFLVGIAVTNVATLRKDIKSQPDMEKYNQLSDQQLLCEKEVRNFVLNELNSMARKNKLQSIELIRNIHLISEELTAESGMVTPTLKLRRHLLKQRFQKDIERMYSEISTL
ncbi:putative long-chain-fatty-acid CoA ligase 5 [Dictyocaulus viviparus]|uniref:long-chain-fatty-acid--CoA ligase n=1 Tax=Dictyocaulus viviparus TaxID=29172 RepID=A0A0D8XJL9_DICVI|nr:putative long-chain-fatty-acid CoA ligase 5 [Dictyocaulus viviparus]